MPKLPDDLYTTQQIQELERIAARDHQLSSSQLMIRVGASALAKIKQHWPKAKKLLIFCGAGNNGGDGFELARQAVAKGYHVNVVETGNGKSLSKVANAARSNLLATGTKTQPFDEHIPEADIIIDAIFGSGLNRLIEGKERAAINAINKTTKVPVLSLDLPSGLNADTGSVLGPIISATITLNFIGLNFGLFTGQGPNYSGKVYFDSLNIPSDTYQHFAAMARRINLKKEPFLFAPRKRTGHKGDYGHLLVIGGEHGMSGATRLAGEAGARVGAGLISIATRASHSNSLTITRPELMCHGVENTQDLAPLLLTAKVLSLGPGLGQNDWGKALFQQAVNSHLPTVVDADALNLLSIEPQQHEHWILTPHPGEAGRLLGCSSAEVQSDRLSAVRAIQKKYGGVVVLKGAGTIISNGNTPIYLSSKGNPGMGSGGMGDVLSGIIGGLLAQGFSLIDAACVGVTLHGMAADKAAKKDGERGMLAMDLMPYLRQLSNLTL